MSLGALLFQLWCSAPSWPQGENPAKLSRITSLKRGADNPKLSLTETIGLGQKHSRALEVFGELKEERRTRMLFGG